MFYVDEEDRLYFFSHKGVKVEFYFGCKDTCQEVYVDGYDYAPENKPLMETMYIASVSNMLSLDTWIAKANNFWPERYDGIPRETIQDVQKFYWENR